MSPAYYAARRIGVLPVGGIDGGGADGRDTWTKRRAGTVARVCIGSGCAFEATKRRPCWRGAVMLTLTACGTKVGIRGGAGRAVGIEAGPLSSSEAKRESKFEVSIVGGAHSPSVPGAIVRRLTFALAKWGVARAAGCDAGVI
jgi:hypothetical protein